MPPRLPRRRMGITSGLFALGAAAGIAPSAHATVAVTGPVSYTVAQNFYGGFTNDGFIPPDTMGAVGPTQFGELINGGYAVYSRSGTQISLTSDATFWNDANISVAQYGVFDPRIQYDPTSQRWFASELEVPTYEGVNNQLLIAVSNSSDLTGGFKGYAFNTYTGTSQNYFADYDTLGVNANGVYVGLNNFTAGGNFASTSILAIDKSTLISGTPTTNLFYNQSVNSTGFTPHPVTDTSADPTAYLLGDYNTGSGYETLSNITGTTTTLNGGGSNVHVNGYSGPPSATQQGTTTNLDAGDTRYTGGVVKVGGIIYGVQSVKDPMTGLDAIRMIGVNATTGATTLDQLIGDPSLNYYEPSLAVNAAGQVVIGFSSSSTGQYVGGNGLVGQLNPAGDAVSFDPLATLVSGTASYVQLDGSANRWGDYSATTLDPTNPNDFWTIQEYASGTNQWSTNISEISLSPSAAPEPSEVGMLALIGLSLGGLMLRARKRLAAPTA